jgi:hypothetical protein
VAGADLTTRRELGDVVIREDIIVILDLLVLELHQGCLDL